MEDTRRQSIIAIFATAAEADAALYDLTTAGVPREALRRYETETTADATPGTLPSETTASGSHGGFWSWLLGEETGPTYSSSGHDPYRDRPLVEREVARGRAVLAVRAATDAQAEQALAILDRHHPLSLEEQGAPAGVDAERDNLLAPTTTTLSAPADAGGVAPTSLAAPTEAAPLAGQPAETDVARETGGETTIPLVSETVHIGTRPVERAGLRIRRYVVERPVTRDVTLRDEQVHVERRAPSTDVTVGAEDAFQERTIEVAAIREEPVVEKEVRVIEEVVVHRQAHERTETVHATERREEVEITDTTTGAKPTLSDAEAEAIERDGRGHAD